MKYTDLFNVAEGFCEGAGLDLDSFYSVDCGLTNPTVSLQGHFNSAITKALEDAYPDYKPEVRNGYVNYELKYNEVRVALTLT